MFSGILKVLRILSVYIRMEEILELFQIVLEAMLACKTSPYVYKKVFPFPCGSSIGVFRHSQSSKNTVGIH